MTHDMTFNGLSASGFKHLLPLVPHDADISPDSKNLRPELLGKVPGRLRHNGWVGMADWVTHETTDNDLQEWHADGAGICMRCHDVVAIDLDITDQSLVNMITAMAFRTFDFAPTRVGNAPKTLLLYRLEEPGSWPTKTVLSFMDGEQKHLIELLGARQQFVVHGIHPKTGKPYQWDEDIQRTGLEGLPSVRAEDLTAWLQEVQETLEMLDYTTKASRTGDTTARDTDSLSGDPALVAEMVEGIPNGELNGYDELAQMAHAVWAACHPDLLTGREIFVDWAAKWPNEPDLSEAERIYDSIRESSIGVQWLAARAQENGVNTAVMDFEDAPETSEDTDPDSFWRRYVYVNQTKRFIDQLTGEVMDKEQFNDRLGKLGEKQQGAATFFMENRRPEQFCSKPTYNPGSVTRILPDGYGGYDYNAWMPGPAHGDQWADVTPSDRGLQMWLQLAEHLFPKDDEREALLDWMANLLQNPGKKPNWHPLIGSDTHGTGKDSLLIPLVDGLGRNCRTILTGDLEGQWTWWAENVQLVVVSEISSFERRAVMNSLKSFMANPPHTVEINKKGMPQYEVPNLFGMVMFTNNRDAVAIENSDRRFFVLWSDAMPLPVEFYQEYHRLFTSCHAGSRAVVNFLKARDVSGRDFQGTAPDTEAKEAMRLAALPVNEGYLLEAITDGAGCFSKDLVSLQEVELYLKQHNTRPTSPQKLSVHLRNIGARQLGRCRLSTGERVSLWATRRVATYMQLRLAKARDMYEQQLASDVVAEFEDGGAASR